MRRPRFYCPSLTTGLVSLPAEEVHHASASLRLSKGQTVVLFDGKGTEATGRITHAAKRRVDVQVERLDARPFELGCRSTLAVAMGRAHRQAYLIEKCTELGVSAIWPVIAERSTTKPDADAVGKWTRRAVEAAKQAGRAWVPDVAKPRDFDDSVAHVGDFDAAIMLDVGPALPSISTLLATLPEPSTVLMWVGPEGGWSDRERSLVTGAGGVRGSLAPTTLRTETAAVAACAAVAMSTGLSSAVETKPSP